jgi:hypothetical protein
MAQGRQYYTNWTYYPEKQAYGCYYNYRPSPNSGYQSHYVYYYPSRPRQYYYYNPQRSFNYVWYNRNNNQYKSRNYGKGYYGVCTGSDGAYSYQALDRAWDTRVNEIPQTAFRDPEPMPLIPNSNPVNEGGGQTMQGPPPPP